MHFDDLRQYIAKVDELGEAERINGADPHLELGAIYAINAQGPNPMLMLFDEIKGYPKGYRIATNLLGSGVRGRLARNIPLDLEGEELAAFSKKRFREKRPVPPEWLDTGPVFENVLEGSDVDLTRFPAPLWHELDGGPYIGTASAVMTRDPDADWVNVGSYRSQLFDRNHIGLHQAYGHHGQIIRDHWFERGLDCPVAISLGQEPSLIVFSGNVEPWEVPELDIAGYFRGAPVQVVKGKSGLPILAWSELTVEGFIMHPDHEPMRLEGGFGEASGYYSHVGGYAAPVIRVDAVYYRNDPIITAQPPVKGASRDSDAGEGRDGGEVGLMKNLAEAGFHDVRGIGHAGPFTVISVHQMYAGHAKRIADWFMSGVGNRPPRMLVLVDDDIDPHDQREVFWAISTRIDPAESVHIYRNLWDGLGTRNPPEQKEIELEHGLAFSSMLIDALKPFAWKDEFPPTNDVSPGLRQRIIEKWGEYLALEPEPGRRAPARGR